MDIKKNDVQGVDVEAMIRQGSMDEMGGGTTQALGGNYEDTVRQLDLYYAIVKRQLLRAQSPVTGLFPAVSLERRVGSVRDSLYCAAAVWALHQAYRRIDDDRGKAYELGQSAVKCMRGILECWERQAARIDAFKRAQSPHHALHVLFDLTTGEPVLSDDQYHHLQIDVVSLFLIFLVQMIASGLQIIYTQDEVAFVQNLVYYVERAYRTPDYGMWEKGTKYNDGTPEIHASSIGMAKAALEACNGCNLFGGLGASWSVLYVDIDAHNRNRSIFETLLPRESSSRGADAALLPTLSWPAFASHDEALVAATRARLVRKLRGRYGFKRFSRDGYKCALEDGSRRYYERAELKHFEGVECEWPLFYVLMIIDGVFRAQPDQVDEYQRLLKARIYMDEYGDPVIPWYYYVPRDGLEAERAQPYSVRRFPAKGGGLFLWGQAVFVVSQLVSGGLVSVVELDPARRSVSGGCAPLATCGSRYSAFAPQPQDLVVQVVLVAESMRLQAMLGAYGIQTQTPHEVEPVRVCSSAQLVHLYRRLGLCAKLSLTGRPLRPIGSLGTSKIYRVAGTTLLCYPLIFEVSEFYLYRDMALLLDDIRTELQFVGRYWRLAGRPTVCLLVREEHMRDPHFPTMLDLFAMLKKGHCDGVKVRTGRLQNLISSSCIEHLDFMGGGEVELELFSQVRQLQHEYIGYQSLTDVRAALSISEAACDAAAWLRAATPDIVEALRNAGAAEALLLQAVLLGVLHDREGPLYTVDGSTVLERLRALYGLAGTRRHWRAVRYCSSLLRHTVDSISPFITTLLVHGKHLTVGVRGHSETILDKPMTPGEIQALIYSTVQPHNVIEAVLQQEVILYCGRLIATEPELFRGVLTIRAGWVLEAMRMYLRLYPDEYRGVELEALSPYGVRQLVVRVVTVDAWADEKRLGALQRRRLEGYLCRVPERFYSLVWEVLERAPKGLVVGGSWLGGAATLASCSRSDLSFAQSVERALAALAEGGGERRQLGVELVCVCAVVLRRNPELAPHEPLEVDKLLHDAALLYARDCQPEPAPPSGAAALPSAAPAPAPEPSLLLADAPPSLSLSYLARAFVNSVLQAPLDTRASSSCLVT